MPAPGVVTANLLAEYQFVGVGSGATVSDTSGNSNTLTLGTGGSTVLTAIATSQVAPTWQSDGLLFDNATNTVATAADGSIVSTSTTDFTAELWVKPITLIHFATYYNFGFDDHNLVDNFDTSAFQPAFSTNWNVTGGGIHTSTVIVQDSGLHGFAAGYWYQVVVTREPSTGLLKTYVNGSLGNTNALSTAAFDTPGFAFDPSDPNGLAALRSVGNDSFNGDGASALFGEIRFYGSVLSGADVLQNYNARALDVTGSAPAAPRKPSSGLSGGMKPLMNGGLNA